MTSTPIELALVAGGIALQRRGRALRRLPFPEVWGERDGGKRL